MGSQTIKKEIIKGIPYIKIKIKNQVNSYY
jgi:hypothetical protein